MHTLYISVYMFIELAKKGGCHVIVSFYELLPSFPVNWSR